jgi:hypothetical protein
VTLVSCHTASDLRLVGQPTRRYDAIWEETRVEEGVPLDDARPVVLAPVGLFHLLEREEHDLFPGEYSPGIQRQDERGGGGLRATAVVVSVSDF